MFWRSSAARCQGKDLTWSVFHTLICVTLWSAGLRVERNRLLLHLLNSFCVSRTTDRQSQSSALLLFFFGLFHRKPEDQSRNRRPILRPVCDLSALGEPEMCSSALCDFTVHLQLTFSHAFCLTPLPSLHACMLNFITQKLEKCFVIKVTVQRCKC